MLVSYCIKRTNYYRENPKSKIIINNTITSDLENIKGGVNALILIKDGPPPPPLP